MPRSQFTGELSFWEYPRVSGFVQRRQRRQAMSLDIVFDIEARLLGSPQAPDRALSRPAEHACGVAFSLPLVAHSRTYAREVRSAFCTPAAPATALFSFVAGNKHLHHFNVSFGHCSTYFFFPRIDAYSPVASRISQGQKHRAVKKGETHYTKLHSPILHGYCFTELIKISISNPFVHLRQQSKNISLFLLITRTAFL